MGILTQSLNGLTLTVQYLERSTQFLTNLVWYPCRQSDVVALSMAHLAVIHSLQEILETVSQIV